MLNFGSDPEVCVVTKDNYVISPALLESVGQIEAVIPDPTFKHPVYIDRQEYKWIADGVAFELTLKHPFSERDTKRMHTIIHDALDDLRNLASKLKFNDTELVVSDDSCVNIDPTIYDLDNPAIYQGFIFGCDPDKDVVADLNNTPYVCGTLDVSTHPHRYFGGHWHLSDKEFDMHREFLPAVVMQMNTVGVFCIANSLNLKADGLRLKTYGKPGRYRAQTYPDGSKGIEYRSPSNQWLKLGLDKFEELVYWSKKGYKFLREQNLEVFNMWGRCSEAIITCNVEECNRILKDLENAS